MNWWVLFQFLQWVSSTKNTPDLYLLNDEVFFAQSSCHQPINLDQPDTLLLDAALFQATNEARRAAKMPILLYNQSLDKAARHHAQSMIRFDFYSHQNYHQLIAINPVKRIENQTKSISRLAENIGQYSTINTTDWYGVRFNRRSKRYQYLDLESQTLCQPYTYAQYARYAVQQWLNSPHHRANLLNPSFTHLGTAGRLSIDPYQQRQAPFGRLVQNFGSFNLLAQESR
ncbi:CAP domain-containing protein [Spirosoma sp. RP8]|uniref:CAP domain-containing protein n=1 Tax=Spirosoma liriopis TaxID=2937440 RepID=A0ABT0HRU9_9BACT|nr:CAP domain-containing protein [Spirosoma liriopis]MCK8494862.1 CAP domain-containing protein [Spirosoma liriopis]